ncbi:hypothetical protein BM221_007586 [Beauveria bassiana]|uniref:Uncharacterized protein n=1 Tax=Beauveria bassiana TaxID=176275 RepID=A0A2N6NH24_BEABA|nr:hypothetical protein BM221_007586 [Beauveria bassiana]
MSQPLCLTKRSSLPNLGQITPRVLTVFEVRHQNGQRLKSLRGDDGLFLTNLILEAAKGIQAGALTVKCRYAEENGTKKKSSSSKAWLRLREDDNRNRIKL